MKNLTTAAPRSATLLRKAKTEIARLRKATLAKLGKLKKTGQFVTIASPALGEGQFVSRVEDIYTNGAEEIVVLKWFDRNNFPYLTHLLLEELRLIDAPMRKAGF